MSLTDEDFTQLQLMIRTIVREEVDSALKPIRGQLQALESDVREIYKMLTKARVPATKVVYK